jgi:hypothetical protein
MEKTFKETLVTVENKQFTTMVNGKEFQSLFGNVAIPITKSERVSKLHYWNYPNNEQSPLSNKFHVVGEPSNISSLI